MPGIQTLTRWRSRQPRAVDALVAVLAGAVAVWGPSAGEPAGELAARPGFGPPPASPLPNLVGLLLIGVGVLLLIGRRDRPLPVWTATLVIAVVTIVREGGPTGVLALPLLALYTVGTRSTASRSVLITLVTAAALWAAGAPDGLGVIAALSMLAFSGTAGAIGAAVRGYRATLEAAEARVVQAERSRAEEAVRLVTDERLRIARELHDVVAHHISVINVQAGVARHLMKAKPDVADTALQQIRESSRTVLSEMSTVLGLLRTGDDERPTQPAPSLDLVPDLLDTMRHAGLRTAWRIEGEPRSLGELRELTAYRVVQESLTNAFKHGTGTAELTIAHRPDGLLLTVRNRMGQAVPDRGRGAGAGGATASGHGIVGMRERVASVGGRFAAGPEENGDFVVRVEISRAEPA